ncbi:hypothetical protein BSLG_006100 [Batrachochytrium salamandrivorans]|nr:hypothetical protein BSLG_006100 [Batrachochytrium salamandrivorans]
MSQGAPTVGLEILANEHIDDLIDHCQLHGFSFALPQILKFGSIPLDDPNCPPPASLVHEKLVLNGPEHASFSIGAIAPWMDLESSDGVVTTHCQTIIRQQIQWAAHIGTVRSHVFVRVPLYISGNEDDGWARWNTIRMLSRHNTKLLVALEIGHELPSQGILDKWLAEPIKLVVLPTNSFATNKSGFPVLSKSHKAFIHQLMRTDCQFVISSPSGESLHRAGTLSSYREYIEYLYRSMPAGDIVSQFAAGYHDYLQAPLQPLMDNLESATYEVFEKDPIKYQQYELAVYQALVDRVPSGSDIVTTIMVVGAGRGPLVDRSLKAAANAGRKVKLYAVEKNANAVVGLRARKDAVWGDAVTVVHIDMRYWHPEDKADILVSELLGSFGDNELSPECLDGAQGLIKAGGISIPSEYVSYIAPLSSSKLFTEAASFNDEEHMETPYVVKFRSVYEIAEPIPLWKFCHPTPCDMRPTGHPQFNTHNTRYGHALFDVSQDTVMHGVAGYFESTLYKDVMISIHPKTHSEGMFSWFPLFFPIKVPVFLPKGSSVELHFWRLTDTRKVWYEWSVVPRINGVQVIGEASMIHNVGGKSYWIGL